MNLDYSFKDYKNCWLYHKNSDERIIIKHIVYFDGSNEVKITLFKDFNNNEEITFKYHEFISFMSNYIKVKKKKQLTNLQ